MKQPFRASKREETALPVQVRCSAWSEFLRLHTQNISMGGLFVVIEEGDLPTVGAMADLQVALPDNNGEIVLEGQVVHVIAQTDPAKGRMRGVGVKLSRLTNDQEGYLRALVDIAHLAEQRKAEAGESEPDWGAGPTVTTGEKTTLDDTDLFEDVPSSHTGKVAIGDDMVIAAAERLIEEKRYAAATRELQSLLADDPSHRKARIWLLLIKARQLKAEGKAKEASATYRTVLEIDENNEEAVLAVRTNGGTHEEPGIFKKLFKK